MSSLSAAMRATGWWPGEQTYKDWQTARAKYELERCLCLGIEPSALTKALAARPLPETRQQRNAAKKERQRGRR